MKRIGPHLGILALASVMILLQTSTPRSEPASSWPTELYDPAPAPDGDFVLPMPCGGKMVFRRVQTLGAGSLKDTAFMSGGSDDRVGYLEERRPTYVSGGFSDPKNPAARVYYLGKYEVTTAQFAALDDACTAPGERARYPQVSVSWLEAAEFANRYTVWLNKNAPTTLPTEAGVRGFLRLPTEAEWEFAARGGHGVPSEVAFLDTLFPMPEGDVAQYVWFEGTESADGQLRRVGLLKPNPLGLHDVIGNAGEIALEPFRLHWHGRLHGQPGGFVVRGGSFRTPKNELRTSYRTEIPFYDPRAGEAMRRDDIGFRLAIASPVLVSQERSQQIASLWKAVATEAHESKDPVADLEALAPKLESAESRAVVQGAITNLRADATRRNEQRDKAAQSMIRLGAFLGRKVKDDDQKLGLLTRLLDDDEKLAADMLKKAQSDQERTAIQKRIETETALLKNRQSKVTAQQTRDNTLAYYGEVVIDVGNSYAPDVLATQLKTIEQILAGKRIEALNPFARAFVGHVEDYRRTHKIDAAAMLRSLSAIGAEERTNR